MCSNLHIVDHQYACLWLKVHAVSLLVVGPVVIVGIREGSLWLVDARGQPFVVPVNHPGLKARCLVAQDDSQAAKLLAERGILHATRTTLVADCWLLGGLPLQSCQIVLAGPWLQSHLSHVRSDSFVIG